MPELFIFGSNAFYDGEFNQRKQLFIQDKFICMVSNGGPMKVFVGLTNGRYIFHLRCNYSNTSKFQNILDTKHDFAQFHRELKIT